MQPPPTHPVANNTVSTALGKAIIYRWSVRYIQYTQNRICVQRKWNRVIVAISTSVQSMRLQSTSRRSFNICLTQTKFAWSKQKKRIISPIIIVYSPFRTARKKLADVNRRLANREISGFYAAAATANRFPRFLRFDRTNPGVGHLTRRGWLGLVTCRKLGIVEKKKKGKQIPLTPATIFLLEIYPALLCIRIYTIRLSHLVKGKGNSILIYFIFLFLPLLSLSKRPIKQG